MIRYQDYVDIMTGGPALARLVPNPALLTPQQLAGVPDIQFEVFEDFRATFDCQSLATLPFPRHLPHINGATLEFKQKYLLLVVPLLAAHSSSGRRKQFYNLATHLLGPNFHGTTANIRQLVSDICAATPADVQRWMGLNPGVARYGAIVKSAADYIKHNAPIGLIAPPSGGPVDLTKHIHGMGMKTACLFFRWMTGSSPDLALWPIASRTFIPVDSRVIQTCRNAQAALIGANPGLAAYSLAGLSMTPLFSTVTNFIQSGLGFGGNYLRADYPFWALANSKPKSAPPICYTRISGLGIACPLLRTGTSPDPRCKQCNCPFI